METNVRLKALREHAHHCTHFYAICVRPGVLWGWLLLRGEHHGKGRVRKGQKKKGGYQENRGQEKKG